MKPRALARPSGTWFSSQMLGVGFLPRKIGFLASRYKWLDPVVLWYTWAFPRVMCHHLALSLRKLVCIFLGPGNNQLPFYREG